jgi:hypothetical protein
MQNLDPMWREGYRRWRAGGANGARKEPKAKDCHVAASMPRSKSVQPKISWPEAGSIPDADDQALALHFERKECLSTSMAPRSAGDQTQPQPKVQDLYWLSLVFAELTTSSAYNILEQIFEKSFKYSIGTAADFLAGSR